MLTELLTIEYAFAVPLMTIKGTLRNDQASRLSNTTTFNYYSHKLSGCNRPDRIVLTKTDRFARLGIDAPISLNSGLPPCHRRLPVR